MVRLILASRSSVVQYVGGSFEYRTGIDSVLEASVRPVGVFLVLPMFESTARFALTKMSPGYCFFFLRQPTGTSCYLYQSAAL